MSLEGKVVAITGASAGIGRATAREMARRGAHVGLIARSAERLEAARREVQELGEEFRRVTEVTYLGSVYGAQAALRRMRPRDRGVIVQVGSALSRRGIPLQASYCGAKHALKGARSCGSPTHKRGLAGAAAGAAAVGTAALIGARR